MPRRPDFYDQQTNDQRNLDFDRDELREPPRRSPLQLDRLGTVKARFSACRVCGEIECVEHGRAV